MEAPPRVPHVPAAGSTTYWIACLLFFITGILGLGYELLWIRKAMLVVGASQIALSTVLTAFFLGLGLGSYLVGRWLPRGAWSPLRVYGLFEIGIGAFALSFPLLFEWLESVYGLAYPHVEGSAGLLFALRFVLLLLVFLPPTLLMGGTLPLLLDGLVGEDVQIGSRTSFLYGLNILGAVLGVLVTCYFMIPWMGLDGTSRLGGCVNLAIGAFALVTFRALPAPRPLAEHHPLGIFFLAAAFTSGFLAIGYQVVWARYFTLFNTGTVYLTAVLLAVYLLALAVGSMLLAPLLHRRWNPLKILATFQAAVAGVALLTLEAWRGAEYRFALRGQVNEQGVLAPMDTLEIDPDYELFWHFVSETADAVFFAPLFQVGLVIFLPVLCLGAGLPSLIAGRTRQSSELRSSSGRLLFWNTLGSSAAGFVSGYMLLPLAGLHGSFIVLGLISVSFSIVTWAVAARAPETQRGNRGKTAPGELSGPRRRGLSLWHAIPASALCGLGLFGFLREDISRHTILHHGYGRDPELALNPSANGAAGSPGGHRLQVVEGPLSTSFVFETRESIRLGSGNVCLAVAYKDMVSTQAVQGHIPCIFFPSDEPPADCLGICLGSGQSFGALLLHGIRKLDVVDISSEVIDLSLRNFARYNHGLGRDPRVRFHLDDGRHFVQRAMAASYDVVSMEPPPPAAEGVYALYSLEFYREVARILRDRGVFMQWLPLYRVTPLDALGIVKTQAAVLQETFVIKVGNDDFMIVSYKKRPAFSLQTIAERVPRLREERFVSRSRWSPECKFEIASLEGSLALILMGPATIQELKAPLLYDDDRQLLSYSSGDRWLLRRYEGPALSPLSFSSLRLTPFQDLAAYFEPHLDPALAAQLEEERAASLALFNVTSHPRLDAVRKAVQETDDPAAKASLLLGLASAHDAMLHKEEAYAALAEAFRAFQEVKAPPPAEQLQIVRRIVRHGAAPFKEVTERWLAKLEAEHAGSPFLAAMKDEHEAWKEREAGHLSRYWFR